MPNVDVYPEKHLQRFLWLLQVFLHLWSIVKVLQKGKLFGSSKY